MVDDRKEEWELCEEREGKEGRGASQNDVLDHSFEATGGILAHFWGEKRFFTPEMR